MSNEDFDFSQVFYLDIDLDDLSIPSDTDEDQGAPEEFTSTDTIDFEEVTLPDLISKLSNLSVSSGVGPTQHAEGSLMAGNAGEFTFHYPHKAAVATPPGSRKSHKAVLSGTLQWLNIYSLRGRSPPPTPPAPSVQPAASTRGTRGMPNTIPGRTPRPSKRRAYKPSPGNQPSLHQSASGSNSDPVDGTGKRRRKRTDNMKEYDHARKRQKNKAEVNELRAQKHRGPWRHAFDDFQLERFPSPDIIRLSLNAASTLRATKTAYEGRIPTKAERTAVACTLEFLRQQGYYEIKWDGITQIVGVDTKGRILFCLCGRPKGTDWEEVCRDTFKALLVAEEDLILLCRKCSAKVSPPFCKQCENRCGNFRAISVGLSIGGGQKVPQMLRQKKANIPAIRSLLTHPAFIRIAGFIRVCLAIFGSKIYRKFIDKLLPIYKNDPQLQQLFDTTVYPASTFNLGPESITNWHFDSKNKANGYLGITALGDFDPTRGGHIVLKTLKCFIEFPPGSTILFLSSNIEHANTPISPQETRRSFTQYAAGGLFRWTDNSFRSNKTLKEADASLFKKREDLMAKLAWVNAMNQLSTYKSLKDDQRDLKAYLDHLSHLDLLHSEE